MNLFEKYDKYLVAKNIVSEALAFGVGIMRTEDYERYVVGAHALGRYALPPVSDTPAYESTLHAIYKAIVENFHFDRLVYSDPVEGISAYADPKAGILHIDTCTMHSDREKALGIARDRGTALYDAAAQARIA